MKQKTINKIKCFVFGHRWKFIIQQKEFKLCKCIWCDKEDVGIGVIVCPKCKKGILHGGLSTYKCPICGYKK